MSRYLYSLLFTFLIYAILILSTVYLFSATEKPIKQSDNVVKISLITPPSPKPAPIILPPDPEPEVVPEPIIEPKPIIKKPKPRPKKKKVVKPKPQPIIPEEIMVEEIVSEPVVVAPKPQFVSTPDLENLKENFLGSVRATIVANKKYPKRAVRQNIEGRVKALFDISQNGSVSNIRVSGARNILKKAVKKSILKSFPMVVPIDLKKELPIKDVSIIIDFILK
ncbi:MAG: energy transducer TonB [Epsilonproteobacteria bacterium]|nr:energy transducer TonB [Campylobacterota bacterium]